jgi:electron transfer flavoprotein alpha subunit
MSVLVFAENNQGTFKKSAYEAVYFGSQLAKSLGVPCHAVTYGETAGAENLGSYGADGVHVIPYNGSFDSMLFTDMVYQAGQKLGARVYILAHTANGKSFAGGLAARLDAGIVTAVNALPDTTDGIVVTKSVFSGKAVARYKFRSDKVVLTIAGNSLQPVVTGGPAAPQVLSLSLPDARVKVVNRKTSEGIVPLPEAELVVSAGRGMKGPENWGIIEELARSLQATTACSRPVADTGWRPHHEHVGQTGVAIKPNLYIAIGISGAIQHLAGVNNSKTIVVINKDPEAPFFKAADYGVVGDLFEIVPRLTEAIRKYKSHA